MFFEYGKKEEKKIDDYTWVRDGCLYAPEPNRQTDTFFGVL
jgi:hypothetical protein